jgi:hypothetical protein
MPRSYLARYRAGEYEKVWSELVALGSVSSQEELAGEMWAVADEMMMRAHTNIEVLVSHLRDLDYQFLVERPRPSYFDSAQSLQAIRNQLPQQGVQLPAVFWEQLKQTQHIMQRNIDVGLEELKQHISQSQTEQLTSASVVHTGGGVWLPPNEAFHATITTVAQAYGPLPITIQSWFEHVGQLDFRGDHPKLCRYYDNGPASDPMVMWFGDSEFEIQQDAYEDAVANGYELEEPFAYYLEIAPDRAHKSNYSGGGNTSIKLPQNTFDGILVPEDRWNGIWFVEYLRMCFQWGGFPGLRHDPDAAQAASAELAYLTKDLLPL